MARHDYGEDFFDDDDLDALPADALVELENNAIQFTQAQTQARYKPPPSSDYGDEFDDEDLDDNVVVDESKSTPAIVPLNNRLNAQQTTQREQFRQQRYGTVSHHNQALPSNTRPVRPTEPPKFNQVTRLPSYPLPSNRLATQAPETGNVSPRGTPSAGEDAGQEQMAAQMREELKTLRDELNAKAGEIAIVRRKNEAITKDHEREISTLRKTADDKFAQQAKALEAERLTNANERVEREFLQREVDDEASKVRRLERAQKANKTNGLVTTPKKKKTHVHRDGFDDDELQVISPSKVSPSKFHKRTYGSPSKPGKRKRKLDDSPAGQLEIHMEDAPEVIVEVRDAPLSEALIAQLDITDDRYDFLGTMLDHRIDANHLRSLEELGNYTLPSAPKESLQAFILGKLPSLGFKKASISVDFCELLILIWKDCVKEGYYGPVRLLVDMIIFALELTTPSIAPQLLQSLVPIAQDTADLVFVPRYKRSPKLPDTEIDGSACMSLLHLVVQGCMANRQDIIVFWQLMRPDFIQCTLSPNQVRADFEIMLRLLSTSVMRESFGSIGPFEYLLHKTQTKDILSRLMHFIAEVPLLPLTGEKFDSVVLSKERIQILQLLTGMLRSPYAGREIALHSQLIGQLVGLLSNELDVLYDYKSGYEKSARIISLITRFLYQVIIKYDDIVDMQKKLEAVRGGNHKYLLCLSRLSYIEDDLVLEAAIDRDVVELAVELLERKVTPEEGEAIFAAFVNP